MLHRAVSSLTVKDEGSHFTVQMFLHCRGETVKRKAQEVNSFSNVLLSFSSPSHVGFVTASLSSVFFSVVFQSRVLN